MSKLGFQLSKVSILWTIIKSVVQHNLTPTSHENFFLLLRNVTISPSMIWKKSQRYHWYSSTHWTSVPLQEAAWFFFTHLCYRTSIKQKQESLQQVSDIQLHRTNDNSIWKKKFFAFWFVNAPNYWKISKVKNTHSINTLKQYTERQFSRKQNNMPPRSSFQSNSMLSMTQISSILETIHNVPCTHKEGIALL